MNLFWWLENKGRELLLVIIKVSSLNYFNCTSCAINFATLAWTQIDFDIDLTDQFPVNTRTHTHTQRWCENNHDGLCWILRMESCLVFLHNPPLSHPLMCEASKISILSKERYLLVGMASTCIKKFLAHLNTSYLFQMKADARHSHPSQSYYFFHFHQMPVVGGCQFLQLQPVFGADMTVNHPLMHFWGNLRRCKGTLLWKPGSKAFLFCLGYISVHVLPIWIR